MMRLLISFALLAAGAVAVAHAEASHSFVDASTGTGTACTKQVPCGTLQNGLDFAWEGGNVYLFGRGPLGVATATKAARIAGDNMAEVNGLTVNAPGKTLMLNGVVFDHGAYASPGLTINAAQSVVVTNARITGRPGGIVFSPSSTASLTLKNVTFSDSSGSSGAAIRIKTNGYNVNVSLENVKVSGGTRGIVIDAGGGGFAKVSIKDSTFANIAGLGIGAYSGTGNIRLYLDNVTSVNNTHGLVAHGARTIAWLGSSTIAGNSIGVLRQSGGSVQSYKDNYIFNNNTDGTPLSGSYAPAATGTGDEVAAAGR